jgi:hypothetical protein
MGKGRRGCNIGKRLPLAITSASSWRFSDARCIILLSIVCLLTSRKMSTGLVCPIRCALSCACKSICGF